MIWVAWRQQRTASFVALGVLILSSIFLLVTGLMMAHDFQQSGLSACLAHTTKPTDICGPLGTLFLNHYGPLIPFAFALLLLPVLLGALVGAPLVAREFEQRTHQLVWLQSITRTRWLTVKVVLVLGTGLLAAGVLMVLLTWWYSPFSQLSGSFNPVDFDFSGPVLLAATVLALALGIFAGTLMRRTVLAIFLTLALILAIRLPVELGLRPNYEPQITVTWPLDQDGRLPITLGKQDWNIGAGFLDAQGNKTNDVRCNGPQQQTLAQCMQADGYRGYYLSYQPADRFWTFQWIETGLYLAISALALGATVWLVRRRLV
jgi:ABC-type transport system involved in multi-copper enzyme maturation permease subunit